MTPFEIHLATALANCSFLPGSSQKRFCRNMGDIARLSPEKELSLRQRHYMELMAWRYRRQLPNDCIPHANLPAVVKPPKVLRKAKGKPEVEIDSSPGLFDNNP